MNVTGIAQYLQDQGWGTIGSSVFVYNMPESVREGILVLGPESGTRIDHYLPDFRKTSFQLIFRASDHGSGEEFAHRVSKSLTGDEIQMQGMYVKRIHPRHEPIVFPSSKGDLLEFSVNFDIVYVDQR